MTMPAMPTVDGLPGCEICGRPASHFYTDLQEIGPLPATGPDGAPILLVQWQPRTNHVRCDTHAGPSLRYRQDGAIEQPDGRRIGSWTPPVVTVR